MFITPMTPLSEINGIGFVPESSQAEAKGLPFKEIFSAAVQNMKETETISNNNTTLLALGDIDDLHTLGIDATKAYLAERLVVELRNRVMDAYSEIMRINL